MKISADKIDSLFSGKTLILLFSFIMIISGTSRAGVNQKLNTIDALDSVIIDLDQAVYAGGKVDIPVYFNSDDTIYAVDFAFRPIGSSITFDTIIKLIPFNTLYNLNPQDSVLRFTSYSLNQLPNLTPIVTIRLNHFVSPVTAADFLNAEAYLNGFPCAYRIGSNPISDIQDVNRRDTDAYPNPFSDALYVSGIKGDQFTLFTLSGQVVLQHQLTRDEANRMLSTTMLESGIYILEERGLNHLRRNKFILVR